MNGMNRRSFLSLLSTAMVLDPERLLWIPGKKTIFIPPAPPLSEVVAVQLWGTSDGCTFSLLRSFTTMATGCSLCVPLSAEERNSLHAVSWQTPHTAAAHMKIADFMKC